MCMPYVPCNPINPLFVGHYIDVIRNQWEPSWSSKLYLTFNDGFPNPVGYHND